MPCLRIRLITLKEGTEPRAVELMLRAVPGVYGAFAHPLEGYMELDIEDDEVTPAQLLTLLREAGHEVRLCG